MSDRPRSERSASVFVVARSAIVRAGLERLIERDGRFSFAGSAGDADAAGDRDGAPIDIVIFDAEETDDAYLALLAAGSGVDAEVEASGDDARTTLAVVVLADDADAEWARAALDAGVRGIAHRGSTGEEILAAAEAVAAGFVALPPELMRALLGDAAPVASPRAEASPNQNLTPRETEVLGMLAEGLANKTIAWRLGISEHTVKFHVASVFSKLGASSRTEAVTQGLRRGLLML